MMVCSELPLGQAFVVTFTNHDKGVMQIWSYRIKQIKTAGIGPDGTHYEIILDRPLDHEIERLERFKATPPYQLVKLPQPVTRTHYSYLSGPGFMREPTGLLDLSAASVETRRKVIHSLIQNGELLAKLPFPEINDMVQLRAALKAEEARKKTALDWDDPRR